MLNALILVAFVETFGTGPTAIKCDFPGEAMTQKPIQIVLEPRPSLKDRPGLFRVAMVLNGQTSMKALAQPIAGTDDRDIMIRGISRRKSTVTIGLRDDGAAALNMKTRKSGSDEVSQSTRLGECRDFETHINRWLPS